MRLRRLSLLRYGHLSDVELELPDTAGLCVIRGPNEAGKSTALCAIADALFGFGHKTAFDFLHPSNTLRVGLTVRSEDGAEQSFVRRKGRGDTLYDPAGTKLPEQAIRRFTGGTGREMFEHMFGLNGERLRHGGAALAQGGGAVGESLFAAGTGLLGLRATLARLDDEAKTLFGGRGKKAVTDAVDRWRDAVREAERRAVPPQSWADAEKAADEARTKLSRVRDEAKTLQSRMSLLQRVRLIKPLLNGLDAARAGLAALADAPDLPADAADTVRTARATRDGARMASAREAEYAARLETERAALARDPSILTQQDAIDRLAEQRPVVLQAERDLPDIQRDARQHGEKVRAAAELLGLGASPDLARDRVPPPRLRQEVRRLINRHAELAIVQATAQEELAQAIRLHADAAAALHRMPAPPDPAPLRSAIDAAKQEGRIDEEIDAAASKAAAKRREAETALAALPLWTGGLDALAAAKLPLDAERAALAARIEQANRDHVAAQEKRARLTAELDHLTQALAKLGRGGPVATSVVIQAARDARDAVWRTIRDALTGMPVDAAHLLPDAYEPKLADADRLADRRADEAQRVAEFEAATAERATLTAKLAAAAAQLTAAETEAAAARAAWHALWPCLPTGPAAPAAMEQWVRAQADLLALDASARELDRQHALLLERRDVARRALPGPDLTDPDPAERLAAALRRADLACTALDDAVRAHAKATDAVARSEDQRRLRHDAATRAADALDAWRTQWAPSLARLGLPQDSLPADADAALAAWDRIAETAPVWADAEKRIEQMTATTEAFAGDVSRVAHALGRAGNDPAASLAARLARQLAEARQAEDDARKLDTRIKEHREASSGADADAHAAEATLAALRTRAAADDDAALDTAVERALERARLRQEETRLATELARTGDEAALRTDAAGIDPDRIAAEIDDIEFELRARGDERETLSAACTQLDTALQHMRQGMDAATSVQDARHALAEAVAGAERYARLHTARILLRSGIERFRRTQQDPLLRAAGRHLATLTGRRYVRLGVDQSDTGQTQLLAVAQDGTECPVDALSDGARDQLYLALRIAAIEAHVAQADRLPFVADDLLVHFDDARAAAALDVLAELGRTTQVILFTHHDHIAALAEARRDPATCVIDLVHPGALAG